MPPAPWSTQSLDDHDAACSATVVRANVKFSAIACVGRAGNDPGAVATCLSQFADSR